MTKLTNYSTVFDGEHPDTAWQANQEFKSFDEVLVSNQEMNGTAGRERFFFGYRGEKFYGVIRWDNSLWVDGQWKVTERAVGLKLESNPAFSFDGIRARGAMLIPYV